MIQIYLTDPLVFFFRETARNYAVNQGGKSRKGLFNMVNHLEMGCTPMHTYLKVIFAINMNV